MSDLRQSRQGMGPVPPDFLTVEEAGDVLRIGRTAAYQLAREFLATGGSTGIPVVRYGRQLRVPRCRLEDVLGGPLTWPPHAGVCGGSTRRPVVEAPCVAPPRGWNASGHASLVGTAMKTWKTSQPRSMRITPPTLG